jgi:hypothetical protein
LEKEKQRKRKQDKSERPDQYTRGNCAKRKMAEKGKCMYNTKQNNLRNPILLTKTKNRQQKRKSKEENMEEK